MSSATTQLHDSQVPLIDKDSRYGALEKKIQTSEDLESFRQTIAYDRLQFLINVTLSRLVMGIKTPSSMEGLSHGISGIVKILERMTEKVESIQPAEGPRRFGNVAFRQWFEEVQHEVCPMIDELLKDSKCPVEAAVELHGYLLGSLGSYERLDYGTGHELSFLAFFGGLYFLGALNDQSSSREDKGLTGKEVLYIFKRYFNVIRKVIKKYTLEPAGSHGVWGLDDHFHLAYLIGAAQLRGIEEANEGLGSAEISSTAPMPPPDISGKSSISMTMAPGATIPPINGSHKKKKKESEVTYYGMPRPSAVLNRAIVDDLKDENEYFAAIAFIYDVKRGPFFEHSPILYDITGVPSWCKVHTGLIKMYNAEVLGKFPVVQHFGFGLGLFPWKRK
ncbi:Phosphotyrosyl phosphatase activator [Dipodascopsis uninucleata]